MNLDEIKALLEAVSNSDVTELELQTGKDKIRIRRGPRNESPAQPPYVVLAGGAVGAVPGVTAGPPAVAAARQSENEPSAETGSGEEKAAESDLAIVSAPIVGTFYDSSAPGSPAFVEIGDKVSQGQVLCIIEAMKLMNEIEAEVSGVVAKRFVANAQPVEYGEALFAIEPA